MTSHTPVRRAAVIFIFVTVLIDILAFGIIIPVLPHLLEKMTGNTVSNADVTPPEKRAANRSATCWPSSALAMPQCRPSSPGDCRSASANGAFYSPA